jgi:hypothetical protein
LAKVCWKWWRVREKIGSELQTTCESSI